MKNSAKTAVHKHEKAMHPGKPLTKLAKGGVTSLAMKKYGRNLARAMNQRTSSSPSERGG